MAVTYGFYDSLNHDRLYNAQQMSAIFDGIINDGVFMSVGNQFHTVAGTGMQVIVKSGRAWFDSTWTLNDAEYPLSIDAADVLLTRIDAVVLEVNSEVATRANTIKVVKGTPASTPAKPTLTNTATIHQHALAYVTVAKNTTAITNSMIEIVVGKTETPYVTAILQTTDITDLYNQWEDYFQTWFDTVRGTLDGDVALNLQNQITTLERSILKADTKTAMGLPSDAVGDDAFNYLMDNAMFRKDKINVYDLATDIININNMMANIPDTTYMYNYDVLYSQKNEYVLMLFISGASSDSETNGHSKGIIYNMKKNTMIGLTGSGSWSTSGSIQKNDVNIVMDHSELSGMVSLSTNISWNTSQRENHLDFFYFDEIEEKLKYKVILHSTGDTTPINGSYLQVQYCNDGMAVVTSGGTNISFVIFDKTPDTPANSTVVKWTDKDESYNAIPTHYGNSACVLSTKYVSNDKDYIYKWIICSKNTKQITYYTMTNYANKVFNISEPYSRYLYDGLSVFVNDRYYIAPYGYYIESDSSVKYMFIVCVDVITGSVIFNTKTSVINTYSGNMESSVIKDYEIRNEKIYYYLNNKIYCIAIKEIPNIERIYDLYSVFPACISNTDSSSDNKLYKKVMSDNQPYTYMEHDGYQYVCGVVDMKLKSYIVPSNKSNTFIYFDEKTNEMFVTGITIEVSAGRLLSRYILKGR